MAINVLIDPSLWDAQGNGGADTLGYYPSDGGFWQDTTGWFDDDGSMAGVGADDAGGGLSVKGRVNGYLIAAGLICLALWYRLENA